MQVLVATNNAGKLAEITTLLSDVCMVMSQSDVAGLEAFDVDETGTSYEENAYLKAFAFAMRSGIPSIADDSGIEIHALGNKPGLHSKRFYKGSDDDRNQFILDSLKGKNRGATFVCAIALVVPVEYELYKKYFEKATNMGVVTNGSTTIRAQATKQAVVFYFLTNVTGSIAEKSHEGEGFAYDKIFIPDGYTQTYSQLGLELKNKISHRGVALQQVKAFLSDD